MFESMSDALYMMAHGTGIMAEFCFFDLADGYMVETGHAMATES